MSNNKETTPFDAVQLAFAMLSFAAVFVKVLTGRR